MQKYVTIILLMTCIYGNIVTALTAGGNYKHPKMIFECMLIIIYTHRQQETLYIEYFK